MQIVTLPAIREALDEEEAMAAIEEGFRRFSAGEVRLSAVGHLVFPDVEGDCHIKGGHVRGDSLFVIKVASGFYRNRDLGLPSCNGFMAVLSALTGEPLAILYDEGHLTDLRTAMAGAIAAKRIKRSGSDTLGVVGTGIQGELQARMIARACGLQKILVWGRRNDTAEALADKLGAMGLDAVAVQDLRGLCEAADLIVTTTPSTQPLIEADMARPGMRFVAVGADAPGKSELAMDLVTRADLLVADSIDQCLDHGEMSRAFAAGLLDRTRIVELGALLTDGERSIAEDTIVIADLTGLGVQDAQIAKSVWQRLPQR